MKKVMAVFALILAVVCALVFAVACEDAGVPGATEVLAATVGAEESAGEAAHAHDFSLKIVSDGYFAAEATCDVPAMYFYSCECGEKGTETFVDGVALGHKISTKPTDEVIVACTTGGRSYYKCLRDGCDHKNYFNTPALGHKCVDGLCTRCGEACEHIISKRYAHDNDGHWIEEYCKFCDWTQGDRLTATGHSYEDEHKLCVCGHKYTYGICTECYGTLDAKTCGEMFSHAFINGQRICWFCCINESAVQHVVGGCAGAESVITRWGSDDSYHWFEDYCEVCGCVYVRDELGVYPHSYESDEGACFCGSD